MCKTYACLNNKFTTYKQKKKKYFEFMSFSSNFPGNSQKIAKLFLNNTVCVCIICYDKRFYIDHNKHLIIYFFWVKHHAKNYS